MSVIGRGNVCKFCEDKSISIDYKNVKIIKKFVNEQGKIIPGFVTGVSAKYQRMLTKEIKKARNIALLPYVHDPRN